MAKSNTDQFLDNNQHYANGQVIHKPAHPGKQPIQPSKGFAVVACVDARLNAVGIPRVPWADRAAGRAARCQEQRTAGLGRPARHVLDPEPPVATHFRARRGLGARVHL